MARTVAVAIIVVLAVPFAFSPMRSTGTGARTVVGIMIGVVFFRWAYAQQSNDPVRIAHTRTPRWDPSDDALTFDAVQAAFDAAGSAPAEQDTSA